VGDHALASILANSSNGGMAQVGMKIPQDDFRSYLVQLGYGQVPKAGLGAESFYPLTTTKEWRLGWSQASMSFGNELNVSLWQHAGALATVLRDGVQRPLTVLRSVSQDENSRAIVGEEEDFPHIFKPGIGRKMMGVGALVGTGKNIRRDDIEMGTKTGTTGKVKAAVVCSHLYMQLAADYAEADIVPTRKQMKADRLRLLATPLPHKRDECYTSSVLAVGHLPDSPAGFEREIMVLVVVDDPAGEKFGSRVSGPTAVSVLAEALGLTLNGEELGLVDTDSNGVITVEAGPSSDAALSAQPWMEANL
jgi:cell division protein FtsI/penicillin-binding protein 2